MKRVLTPFTFFGFSLVLYKNFYKSISQIVFAIGILLLCLEFLKKNSLHKLNNLIESLAKALGRVWSTMLMLIMYFCIITPIAFFLRLSSRDPLDLSKFKSPTWKQRETLPHGIVYFDRGY